MWGLFLFVCSFFRSSREHNLSEISWVVVSFSCKPVFLSFPLGKSLFQLPFHSVAAAVPAPPAFAPSILYQSRASAEQSPFHLPDVLSVTLTKARCSRAQPRCVPWQCCGLCSTMALQGGSAPATVAPGRGAAAVAGLGCPRGAKN